MPDLNVVALSGRIAKEPELIEKGTLRVARLGLVVEALRKNHDSGELEAREHYFNVAVFGAPAAEAARLRIGTLVGVNGRLSHSRYSDREGTERESVEITTGEWVRPLNGNGAATAARVQKPEQRNSSRPRRSADSGDEPLPW